VTPERVVRAVVADGSATSRSLLVQVLTADPVITIVGEAADGAAALRLTRTLRPSIVLLDLQLPGMAGLEVTQRIMREAPTPIIVVAAGSEPAQVEDGLQAVRLGALTVLPRLPGRGSPEFRRAAAHLTSTLKALAEVTVIRRRWLSAATPAAAVPRPRSAAPARVIAIGASTGGPVALRGLLERLPETLAVPVVIVQHMAAGFIPGLAAWLGSSTPLAVKVAVGGEPLRAATVYIAADGHHLEIDARERAVYSRRAAVGGFRPSADVLLDSTARVYGPSAVGVILSGMGTDGLAGARAVRSAGGVVMAQDADSSAVFGMPGAVITAGLADVVGPVDRLARELSALVRRL